MSNFEVGARVVLKDSSLESHNEYEDDDTTSGTIVSIKDDKALVKWDGSWHKPNPGEVYLKELVSELEANQILDKLEQEYEVWASPIRDKMKQAGQFLTEAGDLATKRKRDLSEMHNLIAPLINAMDKLGWRTSSLSC